MCKSGRPYRAYHNHGSCRELINVPIIFFNRELVAEDLERWTELYYVGADASESGTLEGELAADAFKTDSSMDKNGDGICQYVVLEAKPDIRTPCAHRIFCKYHG